MYISKNSFVFVSDLWFYFIKTHKRDIIHFLFFKNYSFLSLFKMQNEKIKKIVYQITNIYIKRLLRKKYICVLDEYITPVFSFFVSPQMVFAYTKCIKACPVFNLIMYRSSYNTFNLYFLISEQDSSLLNFF